MDKYCVKRLRDLAAGGGLVVVVATETSGLNTINFCKFHHRMSSDNSGGEVSLREPGGRRRISQLKV